MINQEVKGTLAKLLATENLTVEHRQVTTAYFDVEKRILCLPIWKTASNTVYDLLVGHEVGHALYTPQSGWGDAPKAFVNVLEDARIEKMMKRTYPGLRKSFFDGYKELWDMDFFGVKHDDMTKLSLIDRINLYYKGNVNIPFNEGEEVWVDRAGKTETFEEVRTLAEELYNWAQDQQEENDQDSDLDIPSPKVEQGGESNADKEVEVTTSDKEGDDEQSGDGSEQREKEVTPKDDDAQLDVPSFGGQGLDEWEEDDSPVDETESVTDSALREALEDMVDDNAKEWVYINLPKINIEELMIPYTEVQNDLQEFFDTEEEDVDREKYKRDNIDYCDRHYESFKKDAQKSVNYLVKQFEMKKSADEYRRAAVSKTGVINTNQLFKYKLTDDIFKKVTTVPEGKNHGLIMHLDWSGSMQHQLLDTLKQTMNLVWFCRKAGIPFRVYAFQSAFNYQYDDNGNKMRNPGIEPTMNDVGICNDFKLIELFSSKQNAKSLEKSFKLVYRQVFAMGGYRMYALTKYTLGGTPLAEAVMCTRQLVKSLKRTENVTKVNVICLTDGESNPMSHWTEARYEYCDDELRLAMICHNRNKVYILRDPETGYQRKISSSPYETTTEIVSFHREITDYNWIGVRICSKSELTRLVRMMCSDVDLVAVDKQWKKERFASIKNSVGFSESFYMPDKGIGQSTQDLEVKQKGEVATRAELQRAFKKHMGSKTTNKTLLNAFIEQIA